MARSFRLLKLFVVLVCSSFLLLYIINRVTSHSKIQKSPILQHRASLPVAPHDDKTQYTTDPSPLNISHDKHHQLETSSPVVTTPTTVPPPVIISSSLPLTIEPTLQQQQPNTVVHPDTFNGGKVLFINSFDHTQLVDMDSLDTWNYNDLFQSKLDSPGIDYFDCIQKIQSVIKKDNPRAIIFILSTLLLISDVTETTPTFSQQLSSQLKYFFELLEFVQEEFVETKVVLVTRDSFDSVVHLAWSRCFSLVLTNSNTGIMGNAGIIALNRIDNPTTAMLTKNEECTDMPSFIKDILQQSKTFSFEMKFCSYKYPPVSRGRSIIFSTYFTTGKYSQYGHSFKSNSFRFMKKWFLSGKKLGLSLGLFHDSLTDSFINRIKSFYSNVEFVKATTYGPNRTPNDGRFFLWYDYLMANPDIQRVIFTDLRDVFFNTDPFEVMREVGNYLFLGLDNSFHMCAFNNNGVQRNTLKCHVKEKDDAAFFLKMHPFYNAGIVGGERNTVINFLKYITTLLSHTPRTMNCNMGTYSFVASKYFWNSSFTGYPFQSAFKIGLHGPTNVAVKHKIYIGNNVYDESMD